MGTKNNPGEFDCYAAAEPDEPIFCLLGRDADAPHLLRGWADAREIRGEDPRKVAEARRCANEMEAYRKLRSRAAVRVAFGTCTICLAPEGTNPRTCAGCRRDVDFRSAR